MTHIRLFVTGVAEEAIGAALSSLFPTGRFTASRWGDGGFTSSRLRTTGRTQRAERLFGDLVGAVQRGGDADYAIFVDDLELANHGCEADVCGYFRHAATLLASNKSHPTVRALRERVSVHFLVPMLEAYLLVDPGCWSAAGLAPATVPQLRPGAPERFATGDPQFLSAAGGTDYRCIHPKEYLIHLAERTGGFYAETRQGVAALRALDLRRGWAQPTAQWGMLGALLDDVADMLGVQSLTPPQRVLVPTNHANGTVIRNL